MTETYANALNSPTTTLTGTVSAGASALPVAAPVAPDAWPTGGTFRVVIGLEIIAVTAASAAATSLAVVTRGAEGTTAASHATSDPVNLVLTKAGLEALGTDGGGGIQFDTEPQSGGYLFASATGADPTHGRSFYFEGMHGFDLINDSGSTGNVDIEQYAPSNDLNIYSDTTNVNISAGSGVAIQADGDGGIVLQARGDGDMLLNHYQSGGWIKLNAQQGKVTIAGRDGLAFSSNLGGIVLSAAAAGTVSAVIDADGPSGDITLQSWAGSSGDIQVLARKIALLSADGDSALAEVRASSPSGLYDLDVIGASGVYPFAPTWPGFFFRFDDSGGTGSTFEIHGSSTGSPILRVVKDAAGVVSYHIKSGSSWVADL